MDTLFSFNLLEHFFLCFYSFLFTSAEDQRMEISAKSGGGEDAEVSSWCVDFFLFSPCLIKKFDTWSVAIPHIETPGILPMACSMNSHLRTWGGNLHILWCPDYSHVKKSKIMTIVNLHWPPLLSIMKVLVGFLHRISSK